MTAMSDWRSRAGSTFQVEKSPARSRDGMVVANHPLASAAGAEMLAAGGNAADAAVAALFTLTIVEPMMVGLLGGGMTLIRRQDGASTVLDGLSAAPAAATPSTFRPADDGMPYSLETVGRENAVGAKAVATFGALAGWCEVLARFGRLSLADVLQPAIRHAERGFLVSRYLSECIQEAASDLCRDSTAAALFLPGGSPAAAGNRLIQQAAADSLRTIAAEGPDALYRGALGRIVVDDLRRRGGIMSTADLASCRTIERRPLTCRYRDHEVMTLPPPSSSGVHIAQMLNILSHVDVAASGFGTATTLHLLAEALKIAFADRAAATADPAFAHVPVDKLTSPHYARERFARIDPGRAQSWSAEVAPQQSPNTTHVTVADRDGMIIASTQTINSLFGARFVISGTGLLPNNYMYLFDPRPGRTLSVAPGKRVTTSMSPLIVLRDDRPRFALGLPGGLRIFGSAMQAVLNLVDHGMSLQEAVEAPRAWTQGDALELESGIAPAVRSGLEALGHKIQVVPHVAGGMNAIAFDDDGTMQGAACWRADGTAIGLGGGPARAGVRLWPDAARRR